LKATVLANPTSLPPGSYTATLSITTSPNVGTLTVPVTLNVSNPPASLVVNPGPTTANYSAASGTTPATLTFTYTTGSPWSTLSPQTSELDVSSTDGIIPFTVTAANVASGGSKSGAVWLRVANGTTANTTTSGIANSPSSVAITVSLDQTTVQSLLPGSYGGTLTFAGTTTANGSQVVDVTLVVSAGPPSVSSIFPTFTIQAPTVNPLITINGQNFFSTSVVTMAPSGGIVGGQCTQTGTPVQLASTLASQTVLTATIANATTVLAAVQNWCICVTNPAPPQNPDQPPACAPTDYQVISNSAVAVSSVLNAASYAQSAKQTGTNADPVPTGGTSIAPGEIVSIFGQNLGPTTPLPATPAAGPAVITSGTLPATLDTASLASTLQFQVTSASGSTNVTVNFASDANVGAAETLANVVAYINQQTTAATLGNLAALQTVAGSTEITLTSPTAGSAAAITVTDNSAAQLLQLTSGSGNVTVNGAAMAFPYQLDNIQVAFQYTDVSTSTVNTVLAPIIMASNNQINLMVPYELAAGIGGPTASVTVTNNGNSATFSNLTVVNENPGIFTFTGQGSGQAAVLNYSTSTGSYTINSSKQTAPPGSTIIIYATGLGVLSTPIADAAAATTADKVTDPVQVTIGGQPCVVTYAGVSPGSISGLTQINAIVPPTVTTGPAIPIYIAGGTAATARQSQPGVTLAVK